MKKILFAILLFSGFTSFAQVCTPDPLAMLPGLNPSAVDTIEVLVNQPMNLVYTVNVPQETTVTVPAVPPLFPGGTFTLQIIKQTITSIDNLPTGTTYACNNAGCTWTGGTKGCFAISGTPTVLGTYSVSVNISSQVSDPAPGISIPQTPVPYPLTIKVVDVLANETALDVNYFRLAPAKPNPASETTAFAFTSPVSTKMAAQITDLAGRVIMAETFRSETGMNEYKVNAVSLARGMYIFSLNNGKNTLSQKFVVE